MLSFDLWRLRRLRVEALMALLTSADNRFGETVWMEHNRRFPSVSCDWIFFVHIAIRVRWFRLLLPPRLLRRGLVGLWLVTAASVKLLLAGALLFF